MTDRNPLMGLDWFVAPPQVGGAAEAGIAPPLAHNQYAYWTFRGIGIAEEHGDGEVEHGNTEPRRS